MTSYPQSASPVVLTAMSVLVWFVLLFMGLRYFIGTEVCAAWLWIGLMVTSAGMGALFLIKEFVDAIVVPGPLSGSRWDADSEILNKGGIRANRIFASRLVSIDSQGLQEHRSALGLSPRHVPCNRRRSHRSFQCFHRGTV